MKSLTQILPISKFKNFFSNRMEEKSRVYIIPNKNGLFLGFIIFALFLMALSYGNNILLLIVFFIFGIFIFCQFASHYNLQPIKLNEAKIHDCFSHETPILELKIFNSMRLNLENIELETFVGNDVLKSQLKYVEANKLKNYFLTLPLLSRGHYQFNKIKLFSTFPFDIYYVWRFFKLNVEFYIFPTPRGRDLEFYFNSILNENLNEEYSHHLPYQVGQNPRRIDWKHYSKSQLLKLKVYNGNNNQQLDINLEEWMHLGPEASLEQCCLWLLQAEERKIPWTIKIKSIVYAYNTSTITEVLKQMAIYGK